jgi:predicted nucleotidyltransferase
MTEDRTLFETEVGSIMWGMQTPESDRDVMQVYAQPAREILSGMATTRNKPQRKFKQYSWEWDYQHFEIGHLVNLLIKGNVNAIWAVTSPIVLLESEVLRDLRTITRDNLSKATYASIHGMAISNYHDNLKRPNMAKNKAYKQALRTMTFGINLLERGEIKYTPILKDVTVDDLKVACKELDASYDNSKLPETPKEQPFRDFLYNLRVSELNDH